MNPADQSVLESVPAPMDLDAQSLGPASAEAPQAGGQGEIASRPDGLYSDDDDDDDDGDYEENDDEEENGSGAGGRKASRGKRSRSKDKFDPHRRIRQHVNPLASRYRVPIQLDANWLDVYRNSTAKTMIVDIGCAKGRWAYKLAQADPTRLVLGLEIRPMAIEIALDKLTRRPLPNLHYLATNVNVDLQRLLTDILARGITVETLCIQFPDPHFKARHQKRRVVDPILVRTIAQMLPESTKVFLQTDVQSVIVHMTQEFDASPYFSPAPGYISAESHYPQNPSHFSIPTERELTVAKYGSPVYRMLYLRNSLPMTPEQTNAPAPAPEPEPEPEPAATSTISEKASE